jgi:hypothetical protein
MSLLVSLLSLFENLLSLQFVLRRIILRVSVLSRVGHFVFEHFDEFVEEDGDAGADDGSDPWVWVLVKWCGDGDGR